MFQIPEYLHVLINPLPVYGLGIGLLALIGALISRSRAARVTALAIVFISTLSAWPVYHFGEEAYDRIAPMADSDGRKWLEEHEHRAEKLVALFYVLAALAAGGMMAERFAPRAALPIAVVAAVLATGTLGAGAYIAQAGGRVRHREFRYTPPPEDARPDAD